MTSTHHPGRLLPIPLLAVLTACDGGESAVETSETVADTIATLTCA